MSYQPIFDEFNEESITEYVVVSLGGSSPEEEDSLEDDEVIDIELNRKDYLHAIKEAFQLFSRANPAYKRIVIPVTCTQQKYELPYVGRGVIEVQPEKNSSLLVPNTALAINLGDGVVSSVSPVLRQTYGIDAIYESLIYGEMYQRVVGGDFQWDVEDGYLYLSHIPFGTTVVSIIYTDNHDYQTLPVASRDWIERYTLAKCTEILGRKRGKYGTPGPGGQQFLLDAGNMKDEGWQQQQALRAELRSRTAPLPPTWGA